ncbi:hypothetical protein D9M72_462960 [compost metagenome]
MGDSQTVNQRQTDAQPTARAAVPRAGLAEQAEDMRKELTRDAAATVRHRETGEAIFGRKAHLNLRALG